MSEPWYAPQNLERLARAPDRSRLEGDFGSYAKALQTDSIAGTDIEAHNLVSAAARARQYRHILPRRSYGKIADIGSGLGFTAAALAREFTGSRVTGYELSPDAVAFAQRHLPEAKHICQTIDPESDLGDFFDLIVCQEFYPFSRTTDWAFQELFLKMFLRHLQPGGILLIELSERHFERTILANRAALDAYRPRYLRLPFDRIHRTLKVFFLAKLASALAGPLGGVDRNVAILLESPRKAA
jgi:SAM-dependent methyltransferase